MRYVKTSTGLAATEDTVKSDSTTCVTIDLLIARFFTNKIKSVKRHAKNDVTRFVP